MTNAHIITIIPLKADNRGLPYAVLFEGQTIIAKSHAPSFDACRYLAALGLTGSLEVWSAKEVSPRLTIKDIVKAAKWTVSESASRSVRFSRYVPFSESAMYRDMQQPVQAAHAV
jgi:hypothetical protein